MLKVPKYYGLIAFLVSIILGNELSLCKAYELVKCGSNNNGSLECRETFPLAQAHSWRNRSPTDPKDAILFIVIVVAILVFLVGCICPLTKFCGGDDATCWKEMDRANTYRTYFPKRVPSVEDSRIKDDGDNTTSTVSFADSNKEIKFEPLVSILEAHGRVENSKLSDNKRHPLDCVVEVCACV